MYFQCLQQDYFQWVLSSFKNILTNLSLWRRRRKVSIFLFDSNRDFVILVATKQEAELLRLEEKIEAEKDARIRLRESSDVVVECIKALQRKLQNETQLRESFVQNSQIEKTAQNKKIDG